MKPNPQETGKMLNHGEEAGPVTTAALEARAKEIAIIRGATHGFTKEDLVAARKELRGENIPDNRAEDETAEIGVPRDPSEPIENRGRQAPTQPAPDEQEAAARLVAEGVEEAQHEQMLAARRERRLE
jgi:hypothetical protein